MEFNGYGSMVASEGQEAPPAQKGRIRERVAGFPLSDSQRQPESQILLNQRFFV
jgi:hypothetical protein